VPTWNYITIHAKGRIRWIQDVDWLRAHVTQLSQAHEGPRPEPWKVSDAPESYIAAMLKGIVGFELEITQLDGKYKLTQNRDGVDRAAVVAAYEREGRTDMAQLMGKS
jgi:transcriptional regulator